MFCHLFVSSFSWSQRQRSTSKSFQMLPSADSPRKNGDTPAKNGAFGYTEVVFRRRANLHCTTGMKQSAGSPPHGGVLEDESDHPETVRQRGTVAVPGCRARTASRLERCSTRKWCPDVYGKRSDDEDKENRSGERRPIQEDWPSSLFPWTICQQSAISNSNKSISNSNKSWQPTTARRQRCQRRPSSQLSCPPVTLDPQGRG